MVVHFFYIYTITSLSNVAAPKVSFHYIASMASSKTMNYIYINLHLSEFSIVIKGNIFF